MQIKEKAGTAVYVTMMVRRGPKTRETKSFTIYGSSLEDAYELIRGLCDGNGSAKPPKSKRK